MFKFHCIHCGQKISATIEQSGIKALCPNCHGNIQIPEFSSQNIPPRSTLINNALFLQHFTASNATYAAYDLPELRGKEYSVQCGCGSSHKISDCFTLRDCRDTNTLVVSCPDDDKMLTMVKFIKRNLGVSCKGIETIASYKSEASDEVYKKIFAFKRMEEKGMVTLKEIFDAVEKGDF